MTFNQAALYLMVFNLDELSSWMAFNLAELSNWMNF